MKEYKIDTFENFLQMEHGAEFAGTKDTMVDDYADWLSDMDIDRMIALGQKYGDERATTFGTNGLKELDEGEVLKLIESYRTNLINSQYFPLLAEDIASQFGTRKIVLPEKKKGRIYYGQDSYVMDNDSIIYNQAIDEVIELNKEG